MSESKRMDKSNSGNNHRNDKSGSAKSSNLSENERLLFDKINERKIEEVKILLNATDVRINCADENGMSFLCQAAFKGDHEMCRLLLSNGANVNDTQHVFGYTALMFAAIGGHLKVAGLLLEAGADVNHINSVGRTAAQMAGFVGQHEVVSMINHYVPREDVLYFTKPRGLEKEPKLNPTLAVPLWAYLRQTNIHPVRLVLELEKFPAILENINQVIKVLELMMEREMKKNDANEMLALKFKYISFFLEFFTKHLNQKIEKEGSNFDKREIFKKCSESMCKNWLKGRESDGFPVNLECFLRESVKQFPYQNSMVFIEIVKTLSTVKIGDEPSALSLLSKGISGQKGFDEDVSSCPACSEPKPGKKCSQCKTTLYCDQRCQRLHWPTHKKFCVSLKEQRDQHSDQEKKPQSAKSTLDESKSSVPVNQSKSQAEHEPNLEGLQISDKS
ncbi:ankyrin repeat and MYND domain-containing protein 2-like [Brevipalpus obovatus]|uniref:ankyrin repeat and MYND domain-containing protein 2-like n=1 Tax=Brevipalpus obovatus TaxID=246614 RepID=UPI003D9F3858